MLQTVASDLLFIFLMVYTYIASPEFATGYWEMFCSLWWFGGSLGKLLWTVCGGNLYS